MSEITKDELIKVLNKELKEVCDQLNAANAALALQGYGEDTHTMMLNEIKASVKLAREQRARAEKAEKLVEELNKELEKLRESEKYVDSDTYGKCWEDEYPDECHPSHNVRVSDASSFDFICNNCGRTDSTGGGWGKLREPCPENERWEK